MAHVDQHAIPCAYIRGGTSKALFFHEKDLPAPGELRDDILKRAMGSPDAHQIDGMGGRSTHTSKIAIIGPSSEEDADINFTFAQIPVDGTKVSYDGNCGNISSAAGAFAIDEGLLKVNRKGHGANPKIVAREVRIYNTNTKKTLISHVPIEEKSGFSVTSGDASIAGVPGTSAPILMDYRNTIGGTRGGGILPSGNIVDCINIDDKEIQITICDVANISILVNAVDLGLIGTESANQFNKDATLIAKCKEIRGKGAQLIGMCQDWRLVDEQSPGLPFVTVVAPPSAKTADLNARLTFMNRCHDTFAGTGAVCLAACSRIPGSVVSKVLRSTSLEGGILRILHPEGIMPIWVKASVAKDDPTEIGFDILAFERTSRRIMDGTIYVPNKVWAGTEIPKTKFVPKKTNLLMTGDINLLNVQDSTTPFKQIAEHLKAADAVISNLECLLGSPLHSHSIHNEGFFADPTVSTEVLHHGNIAAVGIANNINYGAANIMASIATLDKAGIPHAGAGENMAAARKPVVVERGGVRYGFLQRTSVYWPTDHAAAETSAGIAPLPGHTSYEVLMYRYHSKIPPVNRPGIPPLVTTWVDPEYLAQFTADIKALRPQVEVVVASCHWGLKQEVLTYMEQIAHAAIDAGADVVMGHGPHSPLPVGYHAGKPIFYGLGSFSFHMGHLGMAHGDWVGLLASLNLVKDSKKPEVSFRFVRHNDDNETYLCHPDAEQETFRWLEKMSAKHGAKLWIEGDSIHAEQA